MVKNESGTECTIEKYERVGGGGGTVRAKSLTFSTFNLSL